MSASSGSWRAAHGALWYDSARYRIAWLILPQACAALLVVAALPLLDKADQWGEPASSPEIEKKFLELVDKAGKDGDKAAFDELTKAAQGGSIPANSIGAHLYDPADAGTYPKNPVQPDAAKALTMYRVAADAGFPGGLRGATALMLNQSYPTYDHKRGCRYGAAFLLNPVAIQKKHFEEWGLLAQIANCFVDEGSGLPRDPAKAASIYLDGVAAKHAPTVALLTDKLALQPKDLVVALQQNLKQRGVYSGAVDGTVTPQIVGAIRALSGNAAKPPESPPPAGSPPASGKPATAQDNLSDLFERAKTSEADATALRAKADAGVVPAQVLYGILMNPLDKMQRTISTDARRAVTYLTAASASDGRPAAIAAWIYDRGAPGFPPDPEKAAAMVVRALELKAGGTVGALENDTWSPRFWAALQHALAERKLYNGAIVERKNDRTIMAVRRLAGVAQ